MIFKTHIPSYPLNNYIDKFFYYEGFQTEHNIERFLPDGNTEIVIDLTESTKYIYDNVSLEEIQGCKKVWSSGVRTTPICIPSARENRMLVIYFKKGRAFPFYSFPYTEITDRVIDSDLIFGSNILQVREALLNSSGIDQMFKILENYLVKLGGDKLNDDTLSRRTNYVMEYILRYPSETQIRKLTEKVGYSQKHFIDLFKKYVGVSPKSYLRIIRFQKVILEIEKNREINWSTIAYDCGYYDQSHFINDFKKFSGFTPNEYLRKKNENLNYVPIA